MESDAFRLLRSQRPELFDLVAELQSPQTFTFLTTLEGVPEAELMRTKSVASFSIGCLTHVSIQCICNIELVSGT